MLLGTKQKLAVGKILCRKDITVEIRDNEVPRLQNSRDSEIFLYPRRMPVGFNAFCAACEQNVTELQSCINEICWNVTPRYLLAHSWQIKNCAQKPLLCI